MEKILIEKQIRKTIEVEVTVDDIVESINFLPMESRWNYIAAILNEVFVGADTLDDRKKGIIKKYLTEKLKIINH